MRLLRNTLPTGLSSPSSQLHKSGSGDRLLHEGVPCDVEGIVRRAARAAITKQRLGPVHEDRRAAGDAATDRLWHFGWHVTDVRATLDRYLKQNLPLLPLYTGSEDGPGTVFVSSDTYPGTGGVLGLTSAQVADAKAKGVNPNGGAGFAYLRGPDDATSSARGTCPPSASITFTCIRTSRSAPRCGTWRT